MFCWRKISVAALGVVTLLAGCAQVPGASSDTTSLFASQQSRCLTDAEITQWAQAYAAHQPLSNPPTGMTAEDAACTRAKFQQRIAAESGELVGYKVTLSNVHVQKSFRATEPVWGSYYRSMMLPARSTVSAQFGSQPLYKANLLVRVKSSGINNAKTPEEVLAHLDQIIPYIELVDVLVEKPGQLTPNNIAAINTGTRLGVMGTPLPVPAAGRNRQRMLRELGTMSVHVIGPNGRILARGKGSDVMGHPLQSVVWLAGNLQQQGLELKPGQWVSLGAFSPILRPQAGTRITVAYPGLTGARSVTVNFK